MGKSSFALRKNRLDQLQGMLKSRDFWTTDELAERLEVSRRTLARDLDNLVEAGVPIEADRGRGGGVRIRQNWGLGRVQLNSREILSLLISVATLEEIGSPLLVQDLRSVRNKLHQAFPSDQKEAVEKMRKRIRLIRPSRDDREGGKTESTQRRPWNYQKPKDKILLALQTAFFESRNLRMRYRSEKGETLERVVEPHFLLVSWPVWYIEAWDHLRQDIRFFRTDRILSAEVEKQGFRPHHEKEFRDAIETFTTTL